MMILPRFWVLLAGGAFALASQGFVLGQPPGVGAPVEAAVAPVARPNQIAIADLAARLGMELRAAASGKVVVAAVHPDSQAAALDIRVGDILTSVERQPILAQTTVVNIIAADNPEKKIALTFSRDGKPITLTTAFPDRVMRVAPPPAPVIPPRAPSVSLFGLTAIENADGQVVVVAVAPNSAAALAGVLVNDVLLQVEDQGVTSLRQFAAVAATTSRGASPGDSITIDAMRDGSDETFVLIPREGDFAVVPTPAPMPAPEVLAVAPAVPPPAPTPPSDVTPRAPQPPAPGAVNPNERIIFCMALRRLASGSIVVTDVMEGSPAAAAGIKAGDAIVSVAGEKIASLDQLAQLVARQEEGSTVEFDVARADQLGQVQVKMLPCHYVRKPVTDVESSAAAVDQLSTQVRALQAQVEELQEIVKALSSELSDLQGRKE